MARRKYRILRIGGWIIAGLLSFILLITLAFYLGRGWIMNRAVTYLNKHQPGEIQMGKMNLIPFMNFPDVSLQLRNVTYYEKKVHPDSLLQEPILYLQEVFVTLDVVDLIRGDYLVSHAKTDVGFVRFEIYEDSVSNIERALGIRFGDDTEKDTATDMPVLTVDMDRLELGNILLIIDDRTRDDHLNATINMLESNFSYLPDHIEAGIKLDIDINNFKYLTYSSESKRNISLESNIGVDPVQKEVAINPSSMKISGLDLETWGSYNYMGKPHVNIAFKASNEGLEVLNYLFRGVLDLDEIEQIGSGSIYLTGNIDGYLGSQLPIFRINGAADQIGFRIKSIQKDVTDISFNLFATNGSKSDLSEGLMELEGFSATLPEGTIKGSISAKNLVIPKVNIKLNGDFNLEGLERMVHTTILDNLEGNVSISSDLSGAIDRKRGEFLNNTGTLTARLRDVGFRLNLDSAIQDSVKQLNGEISLKDQIIGTRDFSLNFNGNQLFLETSVENLLDYLMDFDTELVAAISVASDLLETASLFRDTSFAAILGPEIRGLHFNAGVRIAKKDLDAFIDSDSIPEFEMTLDSLEVELPVYAKISNTNASVSVGRDSLILHRLYGTVGDSDFDFSGLVTNFRALIGRDSSATLGMEYQLSSEMLLAEDILTFDNKFLLPETYKTEYLQDFHLAGSVSVPATGLLVDGASLNFGLEVSDLAWNFRYYPLGFKQFQIHMTRKEEVLFIDNFKGKIGKNDFSLSATVGNFTDSVLENFYGNLVLKSELLDFNELLDYSMPATIPDSTLVANHDSVAPTRLDQLVFPNFNVTLDVGEFHYGDYKFFGIDGKLRSSQSKLFYIDSFAISTESGGTMEFMGQFYFANPKAYTFSTVFKLKDVNINDLDFEMQSGEETYTLKDNFRGNVSTNGMAELFFTPDFKVDISSTTAVFNVKLTDGAIINFTPLQAAAKYLDNKDLNHVKFATLNSGYSFTLVDSRIIIPLMNIESNIGQLLIEGEQGLDNSYLYLLRLPTWLVKGAAKSMLSNAQGTQDQDQIQAMKRGDFLPMTVWGNGTESEVKLLDKRDKYLE